MSGCPYCSKIIKDVPRHVRVNHKDRLPMKYFKMFNGSKALSFLESI